MLHENVERCAHYDMIDLLALVEPVIVNALHYCLLGSIWNTKSSTLIIHVNHNNWYRIRLTTREVSEPILLFNSEITVRAGKTILTKHK